MLTQPPVITYNLKERGRSARGSERNYNIKELVKSINGAATQERVKTRGMLGYLGHWPRIRFGIEPPEGGLYGGKAHAVEPALVTTLLRAYEDGTVEHKTEFLDNENGRIASRMFENRVGGFSSAINGVELVGFDWVNDPNYSTNRGYSLDSTTDDGISYLDAVMAENNERLECQAELLDAMEKQLQLMIASTENLRNENADLIDELAKRAKPVAPNKRVVVLDEVVSSMIKDATDKFKRDCDVFNRGDRALQSRSKAPSFEDVKADAEYKLLRARVMRNV